MLTFGEKLKDKRTQKKITTKELSELTGISVGSLNSYENDEKIGSWENLKKLAEFFDVSADWLLGLEEDIQSLNTNIRSACSYTGLTEDAVKKLASLNDDIKNNHQLADVFEDVLSAVSMLIEVDGMEEFYLDVYQYMWSYFNKEIIIKRDDITIDGKNHPLGYSIKLSPDRIEKVLLLNMQIFISEAKIKLSAKHDAKAAIYEKASWEAEKRKQKEYLKKGIITQSEFDNWLEIYNMASK